MTADARKVPVHVGGCNAACRDGVHALLRRCQCGRGYFTHYADDTECADCFLSRPHPEPWYMSRWAGMILAPAGWFLKATYRLADRVDAHIDRRMNR